MQIKVAFPTYQIGPIRNGSKSHCWLEEGKGFLYSLLVDCSLSATSDKIENTQRV